MPTLATKPLTKSQFSVTTTAFPGVFFLKFSGLKDKSETSDYADGLDFRRFNLMGMPKLEPMTFEIPFSLSIHQTLIEYKRANPCISFVSAITPILCDGSTVQATTKGTLYLTGCQISGLEAYEVDRDSSETSSIKFDVIADDYYLG